MTKKMNPETIQTVLAGKMIQEMNPMTTIPAEEMIHGKESQETIPMKTMNLEMIQETIPMTDLMENQIVDVEQNQTFLTHYGVLGMKWGVRKQRPSSGKRRTSATKKISSGMKKVQSSLSNAKKSSQKRKTTKARVKQQKLDKKTNNPKKMSDAELNKRIERLELEKKYKNLKSADLSKGKKVLENILSKSAENIGTQLTTYFMGEAVNKAFQQVMKQAGKTTKENIVNPRKGQKDK